MIVTRLWCSFCVKKITWKRFATILLSYDHLTSVFSYISSMIFPQTTKNDDAGKNYDFSKHSFLIYLKNKQYFFNVHSY